jgi:hypothetical protein
VPSPHCASTAAATADELRVQLHVETLFETPGMNSWQYKQVPRNAVKCDASLRMC